MKSHSISCNSKIPHGDARFKKFDMPCVKIERKIAIQVFKRMVFCRLFDKCVVYFDQQTGALFIILYSDSASVSVATGKNSRKSALKG